MLKIRVKPDESMNSNNPYDRLFKSVTNPFPAGRYHSLRARRDRLPEDLELSAWTADGLVMAVRHRALPRFGVQFHPESILTPDGRTLLKSFLGERCAPVCEEADMAGIAGYGAFIPRRRITTEEINGWRHDPPASDPDAVYAAYSLA